MDRACWGPLEEGEKHSSNFSFQELRKLGYSSTNSNFILIKGCSQGIKSPTFPTFLKYRFGCRESTQTERQRKSLAYIGTLCKWLWDRQEYVGQAPTASALLLHPFPVWESISFSVSFSGPVMLKGVSSHNSYKPRENTNPKEFAQRFPSYV